eukprot:scaffold7465_cov390-Prasinococcus_capsulatus_cf.AAC.3
MLRSAPLTPRMGTPPPPPGQPLASVKSCNSRSSSTRRRTQGRGHTAWGDVNGEQLGIGGREALHAAAALGRPNVPDADLVALRHRQQVAGATVATVHKGERRGAAQRAQLAHRHALVVHVQCTREVPRHRQQPRCTAAEGRPRPPRLAQLRRRSAVEHFFVFLPRLLLLLLGAITVRIFAT